MRRSAPFSVRLLPRGRADFLRARGLARIGGPWRSMPKLCERSPYLRNQVNLKLTDDFKDLLDVIVDARNEKIVRATS